MTRGLGPTDPTGPAVVLGDSAWTTVLFGMSADFFLSFSFSFFFLFFFSFFFFFLSFLSFFRFFFREGEVDKLKLGEDECFLFRPSLDELDRFLESRDRLFCLLLGDGLLADDVWLLLLSSLEVDCFRGSRFLFLENDLDFLCLVSGDNDRGMVPT